MNVSANYLQKQFTKERTELILDDIRQLIETGDFTLGAPMREFERQFGAFIGLPGIAVNTGTDALILALKALGIGYGDVVIVQPNTFYADVGAIVAVGATPRFCDVDASHQLDPDKLADAVKAGKSARAVLPVWWYGTPPDLPTIRGIANEHGLLVIEDAAQAVGASLNGIPAGLFGDASAFSFHPMKPLHVFGDGGFVIAPGRLDWLRLYRDHGKISRDEIACWGINARMQTVQAVVALHELPRVPAAVAQRGVIAATLDRELGKIPWITIPVRRGTPAWRTYCVEADDRDLLKAALLEDGIEAAVHYPIPLHLQRPGRALGYGPGDFPVAEYQAQRQITLPCHEYMTPEEVFYVIERVGAFYGR